MPLNKDLHLVSEKVGDIHRIKRTGNAQLRCNKTKFAKKTISHTTHSRFEIEFSLCTASK